MAPRAIAFMVTLIIGLGAGYGLSWYLRGESQDSVENWAETAAPKARLSEKTIQEEANIYKIDITYPQFGIDLIDTKITDEVNRIVAEFKRDSAGELVTSAAYELTSIFDSVYIGSNIVSARLVVSSYLGGAHPNSVIYGLNFDIRTGDALTLDDALREINMSLGDVAKRAEQEFSGKLGDAFFSEGAAATPENYATFIMGEDKVTFIFQPYQVGPYAAGPQEVSFDKK